MAGFFFVGAGAGVLFDIPGDVCVHAFCTDRVGVASPAMVTAATDGGGGVIFEVEVVVVAAVVVAKGIDTGDSYVKVN